MWQSEGPTVKIEDGCIVISGEGSVVQKTEFYVIKSLLGKTVTLSIMTDDYMIHTVTFDMPKTIGTNTFASPGIYFDGVIAQIVLFWDQQSYQTCRFTLGPNAIIRLKKIKLERGTVSTLKNEIVNYAEQIWRCQRYFYKIEWSRIPMRRHADGKFYGSVSVGIRMRLAPSVKAIKFGIMDVDGADMPDIPVEDISVERISGNDIDIVATVNNTSITARCLAMLLDAELHFSAEL